MDLADPTDWATTRLPALGALDALLRCNICKDFFNNAVITNCAHTFCSICIRRTLDNDRQCPTCRAPEQKTRLRRNDAIQEAADAFKAARPDVIKIAQHAAERPASPARKRRRAEVDGEVVVEEAQPDKRTRRQPRRAASQRTAASQDDVADAAVDVDDTRDDADFDPEPEPEPELDDGLVPCPMCQRRMKEDLVFAHLDRCEDEQRQPRATKTPPQAARSSRTTPVELRPEKLPQLNYAIFKEATLRSKLRELGIPAHGTKAQMQRRHTEWTNIWNANSDSARPRPKRLLLQDLDTWERNCLRGGTVENSKFMQKDFDGSQWARDNRDEFEGLIARARAGARRKTAAAASHQAQEPPSASVEPQSASVEALSAADGPTTATNPTTPALDDEQAVADSPDETPPGITYPGAPPPRHHARRTSTVLSPVGAQPERRAHGLAETMAAPARDVTKRPMFEMPHDFRSD